MYDLLEYAQRRTQEENMKNVELYDRASHMIQHKEEYIKLRDNVK